MNFGDLDKKTILFLKEEIAHFGANVIIERRGESEEERLINKYADGVVEGYNDAVKAIIQFLDDLDLDRVN